VNTVVLWGQSSGRFEPRFVRLSSVLERLSTLRGFYSLNHYHDSVSFRIAVGFLFAVPRAFHAVEAAFDVPYHDFAPPFLSPVLPFYDVCLSYIILQSQTSR
jgi:hypothetical protein